MLSNENFELISYSTHSGFYVKKRPLNQHHFFLKIHWVESASAFSLQFVNTFLTLFPPFFLFPQLLCFLVEFTSYSSSFLSFSCLKFVIGYSLEDWDLANLELEARNPELFYFFTLTFTVEASVMSWRLSKV